MKTKYLEVNNKTNFENQNNSAIDANSKGDIFYINKTDLNLNNINYSNTSKEENTTKKLKIQIKIKGEKQGLKNKIK